MRQLFRPAWILVGALVLLLLLAAAGPFATPDGLRFLGRFHPLLVHLPIGILLVAALLEGLSRWRPALSGLRAAVPVALFAGALTAIASGVVGLLLSMEGGYDEGVLAWHRRLGIGLAAIAVAAYLLHGRAHQADASPRWQRGYVASLGGMVLLLALGGHLGGVLTHGADYLTHYAPAPLRGLLSLGASEPAGLRAPERLDEAVLYADFVRPILDDRCVSCHHPGKRKGGLDLQTEDGLLEGGDSGPLFIAGRSEEGELVRRLWLPPGHDDAMPPAGKAPLTVAEAELIRWWIAEGASFEQTLAGASQPPAVARILSELAGGVPTGLYALTDVPPPDTQAVAALRALGASVRPVSEDLPFLQVQTLNMPEPFADRHAALLAPLARQIAWLDLGGTVVTDSALVVLEGLPHLTRLHLERTRVTDAGLARLAGLAHLEYLNLFATSVGDEGLRHLEGLPALRDVYVWQTNVTEAGAARLREARPGLRVDLGEVAPVVEASAETP